MRIDELLATQRPVFSVEFFPPKTETGLELLFETVEALKPLEPDYVSVTYGAGGATRDGTVEIAERIKSRARDRGDGPPELRRRDPRRAGRRFFDRFAEIGIENVLALRGDPPRGEDDFTPPEDGLSSAAELTGFITEEPRVHDRRRLLPRGPPGGRDLASDLAYLKTKVDAGARS